MANKELKDILDDIATLEQENGFLGACIQVRKGASIGMLPAAKAVRSGMQQSAYILQGKGNRLEV